MKKRIIYLIMAAIGTVGFTGCGPGQNTTQDRSGTYETRTGTQMGTADRAGTTVGTTGDRTVTTGTSGTRTTTTTGTAGATTANMGARNTFMLNQATDYSYNNENFRFTPDQRGISITRDLNGTRTPYGTMRSFGNDGYYMVTTTNASGQEETSVGRFDETGNFTVYKYDRNGDRVTEQNFRSSTPMNRNNR